MKANTLLAMGLCAAIGLMTLVTTRAFADEEKGEAKTKIPDTAAGIIKEIKTQETDLGKTIADKKLDDVHHHAFAIRDLVDALPDKSKDLPADKLAKLKGNAKFVASLADRLDKSGDAGNQAETAANFKKLQGILKQVLAFYPDGGGK